MKKPKPVTMRVGPVDPSNPPPPPPRKTSSTPKKK